jgi:molecular chaperone GrpE (heat shock protein)
MANYNKLKTTFLKLKDKYKHKCQEFENYKEKAKYDLKIKNDAIQEI